MSQLFAIVYETPDAARRAGERLRKLGQGETIALRDLVVVTRTADGRIDLEQSINIVAGAALGGAFWGALVGGIFLAPLAGAVGGAAAGALGGWLTDFGIDDEFMRRIGAGVTPGKAALFVLAEQMTPDKVAPVLAEEPGDLLYSSLSMDVDTLMTAALHRALPPAGSGPAQSEPAARGWVPADHA